MYSVQSKLAFMPNANPNGAQSASCRTWGSDRALMMKGPSLLCGSPTYHRTSTIRSEGIKPGLGTLHVNCISRFWGFSGLTPG